ncbi:LWR-salt protein [Halocatena salina]|uniref:LWR-salt protein n=1 Tax=Halocatena salina TaxID=2934340 RepID=A0A8U0A369_9EURY|nr:LWR-salt protein [Halocatena salina]UPM43484.1 LWR-salt protein [Halocatena salina]
MTDPAAAYILRVRFRLQPDTDVRVDPETFETLVSWPAARPEADGWLFFRDHLWRGAVNDQLPLRELAENVLGPVAVEHVAFVELRTNETYLDALKDAIEEALERQPSPFGNATSADEVVKNHLGSAIHVREPR